MELLTKDQILGASDITKELVEVPEWGGAVYVKGLTGAERDAFEASILEVRGNRQTFNMQNVRARLAALSICDEKGYRMFTDTEVIQLSKKSAQALNRLFEVASRLSGLNQKDIDDLKETSELMPQGDFTSD